MVTSRLRPRQAGADSSQAKLAHDIPTVKPRDMGVAAMQKVADCRYRLAVWNRSAIRLRSTARGMPGGSANEPSRQTASVSRMPPSLFVEWPCDIAGV